MVLMAMLVAICSLGFGDTVVQCGTPEDETRACGINVKCTDCGGDPGTCPYHSFEGPGPYVFSLQLGTMCYMSLAVTLCEKICQCDSHGEHCDDLEHCDTGFSNCTEFWDGPYWTAIGICGQGSPCDEG